MRCEQALNTMNTLNSEKAFTVPKDYLKTGFSDNSEFLLFWIRTGQPVFDNRFETSFLENPVRY